MKSVAILLAGGSGQRMGSATKDKVLELILGKSSIQRVIESFERAQIVDGYIFAYRDAEQRSAIECILKECGIAQEKVIFSPGGSERYHSVYNGLKAAPSSTQWVWIHDCARSLINERSLKALGTALHQKGAAVLAHPVKDSIKRQTKSNGGIHLKDVKRDDLMAMETPQAFAYASILKAYNSAIELNLTATDDVGIYEQTGKAIQPVINEYPNPKLTTPDDILYFEFLLTRTPR